MQGSNVKLNSFCTSMHILHFTISLCILIHTKYIYTSTYRICLASSEVQEFDTLIHDYGHCGLQFIKQCIKKMLLIYQAIL